MFELHGMRVFVAVAEAKSFAAAGERLGVTRSAVSQSVRRLEDDLGVSLVERTTRSVRLTDAGAQLYQTARGSLAELDRAAETASEGKSSPRGMLRLTTSSIAESFLAPATLAGFLAAYPQVKLDVTVSDDEVDLVAGGFDAGVQLGEVIARDMIALPVSGKQRQLAVASPAYLRKHPAPKHPRELTAHPCIGWRRRPDIAPYRWEFNERRGGREFAVDVEPRVTTNDMGMMIRMAIAGVGITFGMEETFAPYFERRQLVAILEDYSAPFAGFYLYYPRRAHPPARLRALIDYLKRTR